MCPYTLSVGLEFDNLGLYTFRPAGARYPNIGLFQIDAYGALTAPFCINISNNAKDENIIRSRAIHSASFL